MVGYFVMALVSIGIGLVELRRIWLFVHRGEIVLHRRYMNEIERLRETRGEKTADSYKKELYINWWRHQGISSLLVAVGTISAGIIALFVILSYG